MIYDISDFILQEESEPEEEVQEIVEVESVKHRGFKQRRPIKRPPHKVGQTKG